MDVFKNFAASMDRQIDRNHMMDPAWRSQANQRVTDHVKELIDSGRVMHLRTSGRWVRRPNLTEEEQNHLDNLENGAYG